MVFLYYNITVQQKKIGQVFDFCEFRPAIEGDISRRRVENVEDDE